MVATHHHRSTTKHGHKPFKSRFATKGAQKTSTKGKTENAERGVRKSAAQMVMSKLERRNQARQKQQVKHIARTEETKIFDGRKGACRNVLIVPLCANTDSTSVLKYLNESVEIDFQVTDNGLCPVSIERFKQKLQYLVPQRDYLSILDAAKFADYIIFVLSATQEVDILGEALLRGLEAQGISSILTVTQDLNAVEPAKRRPDVKKSLLSYIKHFFATEEKVHAIDTTQEALNVVRHLCTTSPKGIIWRDTRSYVLAEALDWDDAEEMVVVTGTVRGKGLKADRLVHVTGYGDYQIEKICSLDAGTQDANAMDTTGLLGSPSSNQDSLEQYAPDDELPDVAESIAASEPKRGVLLDDHHYFDDDEIDGVVDDPSSFPQRKLPKGMSESMGRWIVDSDTDESDDDEDESNVQSMEVDDEHMPDINDGATDAMSMAPTTYADGKSEMFLDLSPEEEKRQIDEFRQRRKEAESDLEFPDEIELTPNSLARERLSRYRGLKNFRTSPWETSEDALHQPSQWNSLIRVENYKATKNKTVREALVGGVPAGTRIRVYLRSCPIEVVKQSRGKVTGLFSLLRHEHKKAVVNYSIMLSNEYEGAPIKAKDELILQCGARRWKVRPLFSQGGVTKNNVHKFERFLQPARACVATFVGEIGFGNMPVLWWKTDQRGDLELVGTGSFLNTDHDRVIAKRKILTGHPYKIHKRMVTVRYMFFNAEDVHWFKALPLYTKRGRSGFIKESLGTHGYFKATFDGKINPQDAICISLYKRCFPLEAEVWNHL